MGSVFYGCHELKRVVLNDGLEVLEDDANFGVFENSGIGRIALPSTLKHIGTLTRNNMIH